MSREEALCLMKLIFISILYKQVHPIISIRHMKNTNQTASTVVQYSRDGANIKKNIIVIMLYHI